MRQRYVDVEPIQFEDLYSLTSLVEDALSHLKGQRLWLIFTVNVTRQKIEEQRRNTPWGLSQVRVSRLQQIFWSPTSSFSMFPGLPFCVYASSRRTE